MANVVNDLFKSLTTNTSRKSWVMVLESNGVLYLPRVIDSIRDAPLLSLLADDTSARLVMEDDLKVAVCRIAVLTSHDYGRFMKMAMVAYGYPDIPLPIITVPRFSSMMVKDDQ